MSLSREEIQNWIDTHIVPEKGVDILKNDAEIIEFMLDNCDIDFSENSVFFGNVNCEGIANSLISKRVVAYKHLIKDAGLFDGEEALAHTGSFDFSHTNAEWDSVISLGIYGLRERVLDYSRENDDPQKRNFYECVLRCYDAALRFMKRAADRAFSLGKRQIGEGLVSLSQGAPQNLYEVLQVSIIYYNLQTFFDGTYLRTLGRLDRLYYPYFIKEERKYAEELILLYMKEIDTLGAPSNIPFAICGTDENSQDLTNELSYILLDTYGKAETSNTKIHILCSKNTPIDIIEKAFRLIRGGNNSIVFMSDETIIKSLLKQGAEYKDAVSYHVVGCYECGAEGELTCSCNARVNIPKALELALTGGVDMLTGKTIGLPSERVPQTYEELQCEFERQLRYLCKRAMQSTDIWELNYKSIHSSPFFSGTYKSALEKGGDLYGDYTARYNNSSLNGLGLATATDSLAAIRKAVFEEKLITLGDFRELLQANWAENEYFSLLIKNKYPKFGQNDRRTDDIARWIVDVLSDEVSGRKNVKGGKWRLGLFSIDWRRSFGKKTAASADGRHSGETLSQNTSASFGADKEGATAHLMSVARLDTSKTPNGAIVDIDLHASAVRGDNGLKALATSLKTYFELGGFAVHYNVLDTNILKDAKQNPEKYPTLQVRLCGWNVLFSSLSEAEKDEFIARSMK